MDQNYEKRLLGSPYKSPIKNLTSPLKSPIRDSYSDRFIPVRSNAKWKVSPSYELFGNRSKTQITCSKQFSDYLHDQNLRIPDLLDSSSLPIPSSGDISDPIGSASLPATSNTHAHQKTFDIMAALLENELGSNSASQNSLNGFDSNSENVVVERRVNNVFSFRIPKESPHKLKNSSYMMSPVSEKSQKLLQQPQKQVRGISKIPYKVLDAPELQDDFYLNLVDWSSQNMLAVGLGPSVYLWSAYNSQVVKLFDSTPESDVIASVAWYKKGTHLAVGTYRGRIQLWDVSTKRRVRVLNGHEARVGALAWNCDLLASGSRDRHILLRDLRATPGSGGGPSFPVGSSDNIDSSRRSTVLVNGASSVSNAIYSRFPDSAFTNTSNLSEEQRAEHRIRSRGQNILQMYQQRMNQHQNEDPLEVNDLNNIEPIDGVMSKDIAFEKMAMDVDEVSDNDYSSDSDSNNSYVPSDIEIEEDTVSSSKTVRRIRRKQKLNKLASLPPSDPYHAVAGTAHSYTTHFSSLYASNDSTQHTYGENIPSGVSRILRNHKQEVCGLRWSPDSQYLASGGNDNRLLIWDPHRARFQQPVLTYESHVAAVKAIAWSPHKHGLLASGGGTADRTIRFWNILTGQALKHIDTGSQVCNLAWSEHSNEFVSTHGYSQNQIVIWRYPSLTQIAKLVGHTYRVLFLAMSPDGENIVTGAGDETLRFWHVFDKAKRPNIPSSNFSLFSGIR